MSPGSLKAGQKALCPVPTWEAIVGVAHSPPMLSSSGGGQQQLSQGQPPACRSRAPPAGGLSAAVSRCRCAHFILGKALDLLHQHVGQGLED